MTTARAWLFAFTVTCAIARIAGADAKQDVRDVVAANITAIGDDNLDAFNGTFTDDDTERLTFLAPGEEPRDHVW